ncbi:MAG TPA: hypothetical protein EYN91_12490 [Candidatus Melainabacteria bacterium]|jgi:outer membrane lipoprotein-sorting protein|nr:hypothetical protein [Candidatus Melainabacteria bacterium]
MNWQSKTLVALFLSIFCSLSFFDVAAQASLEIDPDSSLPDTNALKSMAKSAVGTAYVNQLKEKAAKLHDYKCYCRLYTRKGGVWKDYGGADYLYKYRGLFKATIKTKDYRNGSVVVRDPSGVIKGCGGGTLSFMKITLKEDSRTLQLPTGYSLAQSDFGSLYEVLATSLNSGAAASMTQSANVKAFPGEVSIIVLRSAPAPDSPILEVLYISNDTKTPVGWHTFQNGVPHALVLFQNLETNKGLSEDLFAF